MMSFTRECQEWLLGRPVRDVLSEGERASLTRQRVLVTGGGGSIGAELCRQIASCAPASLTIFEQSEYALFQIQQELARVYPHVDIRGVLGDVTRRADIDPACRLAAPHAVYHAAAYKHVVLTETALVPAVRTNVLGTVETVRAARRAGARFVLISSDKAAEPRSVMGATKRLAEMVSLGAASRTFRPVVVRFGNVLGSTGSFVEIMERCVAQGRSIPVTHPDATRYFMTAREAVSLVLKADAHGRRAEVFWLDMGEPLRIGDLVDRFVEWSAAHGRARVGIEIIGLRDGEKMREELTTQGLVMRATSHPLIWSARQHRIDSAGLEAAVRALRRGTARGDAAGVLLALETAVEGFVASETAQQASAAALAPPAPAVAAA
jgi:FlaA1/EpsC-like NDP-sugar epimerase